MNSLRPGWILEIISNPIRQRAMQSRFLSRPCIGRFTDPVSGRPVVVDMGQVFIRVPLVFRAASGSVNPSVLEVNSGAAPNAEKTSGSYVTPGQSAMDRALC